MSEDLNPVIIGVAQQTWRDRGAAGTPVDALQAVAEQALADSGAGERLRGAIDAVVQVPFLMNQVPQMAAAMPRNPGAALAERLGLTARSFSADVGGNLPQYLVNQFAARLAAGEHRVVMIAGVELLNTFLGALRRGEAPPNWSTGRDDDPELTVQTPPMSHPSELAHGLYEPVAAYPLFETALRHAAGLELREHRQRLAELVSAMSRVAAANPLAWKPQALTPEQVLSTEGGNRYICHPYTKVMNSILAVDMAACVLLTTAGQARDLGVPPEQWVYLRGGASANDARYLSERPSLHQSPALKAAAAAALESSGLALDALSLFDLYSCFPSAVQVACDALGLPVDDPRGVTVTGGLTLFGGPGNNYSLHAIAEMVTQLRQRAGASGLVSANGGYLTKHSVGIYATEAPATAYRPTDDAALQAQVDALPQPTLADRADGRLTIEASTVRFEGEQPTLGIVLGRLADGRRCLAQLHDEAGIQRLMDEDCVGVTGEISGGEPVNRFSFQKP